MTLVSEISTDAYRAGERYMFTCEHQERLTSRRWPPAIYSTGYTGRPDYINRTSVMDYMASQLLPKTHALLSIDSGGTATFGNDTAIQAIDQAVGWLEGQLRTGPFLLVGTSMGFMDLMAWARGHQGKVKAAIGFCPGINLTAGVVENRAGAAADVNLAYGGAYDSAVHGPTHDPLMYASTLDFPIMVLNASNDTTTPSVDTQAFASAAPHCTFVNLGAAGNHTQSAVTAACGRQELRDFIAAHS